MASVSNVTINGKQVQPVKAKAGNSAPTFFAQPTPRVQSSKAIEAAGARKLANEMAQEALANQGKASIQITKNNHVVADYQANGKAPMQKYIDGELFSTTTESVSKAKKTVGQITRTTENASTGKTIKKVVDASGKITTTLSDGTQIVKDGDVITKSINGKAASVITIDKPSDPTTISKQFTTSVEGGKTVTKRMTAGGSEVTHYATKLDKGNLVETSLGTVSVTGKGKDLVRTVKDADGAVTIFNHKGEITGIKRTIPPEGTLGAAQEVDIKKVKGKWVDAAGKRVTLAPEKIVELEKSAEAGSSFVNAAKTAGVGATGAVNNVADDIAKLTKEISELKANGATKEQIEAVQKQIDTLKNADPNAIQGTIKEGAEELANTAADTGKKLMTATEAANKGKIWKFFHHTENVTKKLEDGTEEVAKKIGDLKGGKVAIVALAATAVAATTAYLINKSNAKKEAEAQQNANFTVQG